MDKNNNKKRKNLIQEFLTYTGSDPSTNEIIGFLAIKNAKERGEPWTVLKRGTERPV